MTEIYEAPQRGSFSARGQLLGVVEPDGNVYEAPQGVLSSRGQLLGVVEPDGNVYEAPQGALSARGQLLGIVESDGKIYEAPQRGSFSARGQLLGVVESDGKVYEAPQGALSARGQILGMIEGADYLAGGAALLFFFIRKIKTEREEPFDPSYTSTGSSGSNDERNNETGNGVVMAGCLFGAVVLALPVGITAITGNWNNIFLNAVLVLLGMCILTPALIWIIGNAKEKKHSKKNKLKPPLHTSPKTDSTPVKVTTESPPDLKELTVQCVKCGNIISASSKFCRYCGNSSEAPKKAVTEASSAPEELTMQCSKCHNTISASSKFCRHCGNSSEMSENKICPHCKSEISSGFSFCNKCGQKIN